MTERNLRRLAREVEGDIYVEKGVLTQKCKEADEHGAEPTLLCMKTKGVCVTADVSEMLVGLQV
jgi:hypothetical protein